MKLTFLGTGAGETYPEYWCECPHCTYARKHRGKNLRTNSSMVIDEELLIDIGPSCFDNAARFGVNLSKLKTLLVTHPHEDHIYDLPNLYNILQPRVINRPTGAFDVVPSFNTPTHVAIANAANSMNKSYNQPVTPEDEEAGRFRTKDTWREALGFTVGNFQDSAIIVTKTLGK